MHSLNLLVKMLPEQRAWRQFARLRRAETGNQVSGSILKFDGRPFTPAYILAQLRKEVA